MSVDQPQQSVTEATMCQQYSHTVLDTDSTRHWQHSHTRCSTLTGQSHGDTVLDSDSTVTHSARHWQHSHTVLVTDSTVTHGARHCCLWSRCSTLVRNTVVRATFKVNGKPPILGSRSPLTPWPIDLKFDMCDYVGHMTPYAKKGKNRPRRAVPAKRWNVNVKCGSFLPRDAL